MMKNLIKICFFGVLICGINVAAKAQIGAICGNPAIKNCVGQYDEFAPQDLIFNTGRAQLGTGTHHESKEFYAVILESVKADRFENGDCRFVREAKRKSAQKLFPSNKVFASRTNCGGCVVQYAGASDDYNFMAIYAGESESQAAKILAKVKKKYPSANIRKMKVILDFADE